MIRWTIAFALLGVLATAGQALAKDTLQTAPQASALSLTVPDEWIVKQPAASEHRITIDRQTLSDLAKKSTSTAPSPVVTFVREANATNETGFFTITISKRFDVTLFDLVAGHTMIQMQMNKTLRIEKATMPRWRSVCGRQASFATGSYMAKDGAKQMTTMYIPWDKKYMLYVTAIGPESASSLTHRQIEAMINSIELAGDC